MPTKKPQRFDVHLGKMFQDEGYEFLRMGNSGFPVVRDIETGKEQEFDDIQFLKAEGVDPAQANISYNTPDQALPESPLSITQRAAFAGAGNEKGQIDFLKRNFEDAIPHKDKGWVVKENGVWKQVDPSMFASSDPWEMAKEFGKEMADQSDVVLNALLTGGGAALGTIGGPAGILAGAAAGGALSGYIRTSLGRLSGTYQATDEEQLKDIGLESLLSLGGQAVALGARPTFQMLKKAADVIVKTPAKEAVIALYGNVAGIGSGSMRNLMEKSARVTGAMKQAVKESGGMTAGIKAHVDKARDLAIKRTDEFLDEASAGLNKKYAHQFNEIITKAEQNKMSVDFKGIGDDAINALKPYGKVEEVAKKGLTFRPYTQAEVASLRDGGMYNARVINEDAIKVVQNIVDEIGATSKVGTRQGQTAARGLQELNKRLNSLGNPIFKGSKNHEAKQAVADISSSIRTRIGQEMSKNGLGDKWTKLQFEHAKYKDAVDLARKTLNKDGGEAFLDKIVQETGKKRKAVGTSEKMAELIDEISPGKGARMLDDIQVMGTAANFLEVMPRGGLARSVVVGTGAYGMMTGGLSLSAVPALVQFSPRWVANQANALRLISAAPKSAVNAFGNALNFLKIMTPAQRKQLMSRPELFQAFIRTPFVEMGQEKAAQDFVNNALSGVIGGQNQ